MQCHLFHLSISTHIACNAQTSLKWHWTKENKEHIKELNCGKKKSNKRARIKESRPKRHTHEMNRGRKKEEGTHEQNRNEMKAAAAIRTTQQRTTQRWRRRRGTQSCIQVKTVAFQIKLPSWSFKSCLSHLKDVDYVRAHTQQKIKKKRGKKRAHNKSWKWERERKKDTTTKRYASRAHTKHTLYAFGRAIGVKYQGNTPMNRQMPSNHLECVGTESKSVPLNFGWIWSNWAS